MDDTELKVAALTKQVAEGDEQAFAKFYETLNPYVTKNVTRVLSRYSQPSILQDERDNIIQETWATVWAHRKQLSSESVYEFIILKLYEVIKYNHFPAEARNRPLSAANTIEDKRSPRGWPLRPRLLLSSGLEAPLRVTQRLNGPLQMAEQLSK